jgi:hypothetical protein
MAKEKKTRKSPHKRITRRRRKNVSAPNINNIIDFDQFYKIVNKVQIDRESITFKVSIADDAIIEHHIKDLEMPFEKKNKEKYIEYILSPGEKKIMEDDEAMEEFPDEILEDGQIFFDE